MLSTPAGGCARLDVMAGSGIVETAVAQCRRNGSPGRITVESLQIGDDTFLLARIVHAEPATSTLELFGFLCGRIVRVPIGNDVARPGALREDFPNLIPAFDRAVIVTGPESFDVVGGTAAPASFRVEGCTVTEEREAP